MAKYKSRKNPSSGAKQRARGTRKFAVHPVHSAGYHARALRDAGAVRKAIQSGEYTEWTSKADLKKMHADDLEMARMYRKSGGSITKNPSSGAKQRARGTRLRDTEQDGSSSHGAEHEYHMQSARAWRTSQKRGHGSVKQRHAYALKMASWIRPQLPNPSSGAKQRARHTRSVSPSPATLGAMHALSLRSAATMRGLIPRARTPGAKAGMVAAHKGYLAQARRLRSNPRVESVAAQRVLHDLLRWATGHAGRKDGNPYSVPAVIAAIRFLSGDPKGYDLPEARPKGAVRGATYDVLRWATGHAGRKDGNPYSVPAVIAAIRVLSGDPKGFDLPARKNPSRQNSQHKAARRNPGAPMDRHLVENLILTMDNDGRLYDRKHSFVINLVRKHKAGKYSAAQAPKLWLYWVDEGAKVAAKADGSTGFGAYSKPIREVVAKHYAAEFDVAYRDGEYSNLVTKPGAKLWEMTQSNPHRATTPRAMHNNPRKAVKEGYALVRRQGMKDVVVSLHKSRDAAEAAMVKKGGIPHSQMTLGYGVTAFGPGTSYELLDSEFTGKFLRPVLPPRRNPARKAASKVKPVRRNPARPAGHKARCACCVCAHRK